MIEIIPYSDEYAAVFKVLNLEWLDKYNLTESHDLLILNDPKGTIIDNGGAIFLAKSGDEIVGSAAIINEGYGVFELAKMTVATAFQGKGISKLLLEKCLEAAKAKNAKKLILFSNSQLQTAISLYKKYGFKHVDVTDAPFLTADIKMELPL
ncbi:GNAT family N-acetyltransferase [Panacibacter ginsenosidivorans]|uniref:GNAT family N-acetyltransferase n=1 Tax=Panacibacter ginsenosidivorans TaxID=1813871 RepID=A0A5B8VFQ8_9BACT|nr:GNAT family N-acetyltransferase [Panacibacter ginsenosidivorans]QEC69915.1 GNAT family N-acetyltransferase [Panacibacter ginsenosidivorans]